MQATALIYAVVAGVLVLTTASARREQRRRFLHDYQQVAGARPGARAGLLGLGPLPVRVSHTSAFVASSFVAGLRFPYCRPEVARKEADDGPHAVLPAAEPATWQPCHPKTSPDACKCRLKL